MATVVYKIINFYSNFFLNSFPWQLDFFSMAGIVYKQQLFTNKI